MAKVTLNLATDVELVRGDDTFVLMDGQLADVHKFNVYVRRYNFITQFTPAATRCVIGNKFVEWAQLGSYTGPLDENTASSYRMDISCKGTVIPFGFHDGTSTKLKVGGLNRLLIEGSVARSNILSALPMLWVEDPNGQEVVLAGEGKTHARPILPVLALSAGEEFCPDGFCKLARDCVKAITKERGSWWNRKRLFIGKHPSPSLPEVTDKLMTPQERRLEIMSTPHKRRIHSVDVDMKLKEAKDAMLWFNTTAQDDLIDRILNVGYSESCSEFKPSYKDIL